MSDPADLRTLIANAAGDFLSDNFHAYLEQDVALELADAVIAELGLEPQVHYDPDCDFYRYVTDWIDPQTKQRVDLP